MSGQDLRLPPEIWYQILTKLPVKSILRSRSVCRTWYSLISSPNFASDHTATGDRVLLHRRENLFDSTTKSNFSLHDESFVESHEHHDVPELLLSPEVEIVGSCDGLICFFRIYKSVHSFLIWNPSIGKLVELPLLHPSIGKLVEPPLLTQRISSLLGFGFDSESRDYKVMRVVYLKTYGSNDEVVAETDIFELRKGVWRSSSSPMRPYYFSQPCVYLSGSLHWIADHDNLDKYVLLPFNLSSEVLHETEMVLGAVEIIEDDGCLGSYAELMPITGLLSVAVLKENQQEQYCISVWLMKEYGVTESWTKLFNIELPHTMHSVSLTRFWENGEVFLVERVVGNKDGCNVLVFYNPESKKSKALISTGEHLRRVCFYKESLVLL